MMHVGPLLTCVDDLEVLDACLATPMYDTLKIVAGWGVNHGWATETRAFALACAPTTIVRTRSGDGCAGHRTLNPQDVLGEIAPWYALKRRIWIEIGNEPNNLPTPLLEAEIWGWRFYLRRSFARANSRCVWPILPTCPIVGGALTKFAPLIRFISGMIRLPALQSYGGYSLRMASWLWRWKPTTSGKHPGLCSMASHATRRMISSICFSRPDSRAAPSCMPINADCPPVSSELRVHNAQIEYRTPAAPVFRSWAPNLGIH